MIIPVLSAIRKLIDIRLRVVNFWFARQLLGNGKTETISGENIHFAALLLFRSLVSARDTRAACFLEFSPSIATTLMSGATPATSSVPSALILTQFGT